MLASNKVISTNQVFEQPLDVTDAENLTFQFGVSHENLNNSLTGTVSIAVRYLGSKQYTPLRDSDGDIAVVNLSALDGAVAFATWGLFDSVRFTVENLTGGGVVAFWAGV